MDQEDEEQMNNNKLHADKKDWFFTFMCMNIPLIGWIYLFRLAHQKNGGDRKEFAQAYLYYKLIFLVISLIILLILLYLGIKAADRLFAYMEML